MLKYYATSVKRMMQYIYLVLKPGRILNTLKVKIEEKLDNRKFLEVVEGFQFLHSLVELCKRFRKWS